MNSVIVFLLVGLLAGAGGGVAVYHYVTTIPPSWQSEIISHISLTSTVASISNVDFLYQGDYTNNESTVRTIGMWSLLITAKANGETVTNMRLITLDIADASPDYWVNIFFISNPKGFTLKYDDTVVNTATAFNVQLHIDANSFALLSHNAN